MKRNRSKALVVGAGIALVTLLFAVVLRPREPASRGKPLADWVEQLQVAGAAQKQARAAIREIGPPAAQAAIPARREAALALCKIDPGMGAKLEPPHQ